MKEEHAKFWLSLGSRLRELREAHGYSQQYIAEYLSDCRIKGRGLTNPFGTRAWISLLELGKRRVTTLEIAMLARLYSVPLDSIVPTEKEAKE